MRLLLRFSLLLCFLLLSSCLLVASVRGDDEMEEPAAQKEVDTDSLFELNVFECKAPRGEVDTDRTGRLPPGSVMTLCFRPQNPTSSTKFRGLETMEFVANLDNQDKGPTQEAVKNNQAVNQITRALCPVSEDPTLCVAAARINDEFFEKAYNNAAAVGKMIMEVNGEQRKIPFEYEFLTAKQTKPPPVEHDFYDMPMTPLPFPCSHEIRLWLLAALLLTLLEFAFSPSETESTTSSSSSSSKGGKKSGEGKASVAGGKKKKSKKE